MDKIETAAKVLELKRKYEYLDQVIKLFSNNNPHSIGSRSVVVLKVGDRDTPILYNALGLTDVQLSDLGREALLLRLKSDQANVRDRIVDLGYMNRSGEWL